MKKILFVLITLMSISTLSTAQKSRSSSKSSSSSVRADRQIAITTNAGLKTMTGFGLIGSYYVTPNIAADLGIGISLRGPRFGVRGRYLFSDKNFSPILGLGINVQGGTLEWPAGEVEFPVVDENGELVLDADGNPQTQLITSDVTLKSSVYGQAVTGFEWMTDGGFVLGLTLGYRIAFNDAIDGVITTDGQNVEATEDLVDLVNDAFGNGLSFALNLGYAF